MESHSKLFLCESGETCTESMHVRYYGALPGHNFCMWQWTNNEEGSGILLQWITPCAWFWVKCIKQFDCAARCWSQTMPPRFRLEHCVTHDWYNFAWEKYPYMIWILTKLLLISKPHINEPHSQNLSSWHGMLLTWMKSMWMIFYQKSWRNVAHSMMLFNRTSHWQFICCIN